MCARECLCVYVLDALLMANDAVLSDSAQLYEANYNLHVFDKQFENICYAFNDTTTIYNHCR